MPETRVPMTLRDHFLQDPFFSSSWTDMEKVREHFYNQAQNMSKMFEDNWSSTTSRSESKTVDNSGSMVPIDDSSIFKNWLMPRNWMMPKLFDEKFESMLDFKDNNLISVKNDDTKMEISLNTTGYKPDELKVNVSNGELSIEGKHEEKTESGQTMVSRQFSKKYSLPSEAKLTEVVSNLSQDGVMVITVPKEKRIQEIKEDNKNLNVEHTKSTAGTTAQNQMSESRKEQAAFSETNKLLNNNSVVPTTLRNSFFDDPFFKDTWIDIQSSHKNFFEESRKRFEESMKSLESSFKSSSNSDSGKSSEWITPEIFGTNADSIFNSKDNTQIRMTDDENKLEISLDTNGYKPDELKVEAGQGMICVEGKHEEKSEAGHVMVSRQFSRRYGLPDNAKPEDVVSNLSQDGVLVISVPKRKALKQENRTVPIAIK